jgi:lysophospholipase L1-like esterase
MQETNAKRRYSRRAIFGAAVVSAIVTAATSGAFSLATTSSTLAVGPIAAFGWYGRAYADTVNPWMAAYQRSVYMTGDSLTCGTWPYLQYLFDIWDQELQVKAYPGVTIQQALPWQRAEVSGPFWPPTAVIALGSNDVEPLPQLMWWIEGTIDTFPAGERIIWVNYASHAVDVTGKNAVLDYVASFHRNVTVLDWDSVISRHPEDFLPDGVHYTPAGYALRAITIAESLPRVP